MGDFADDYGGYDFYDRMELDEQRYQERRAQRAKLLTPLKPEQEPMHPELRKMWEDYFDKCFRRKPLRSYEIAQILDRERMKWNKSPPTHEFDLAFVRAIEAAHGIKE